MDKLTAAKYFMKVADTGSFSKTARLLNLPVSTISRRVKDLEQNLGVELIKRSTRHLSLTDIGATYYKQIESAVNDFELADQIALQTSSRPKGKLKISALPSYANIHLYPIMEKFRKIHPEIIIESLVTDNVHDVMKDRIDFAIRPTSNPPENLIANVIDHHKMAIIASPEYIKAHGRPKNWSDIIHHKAICYGRCGGVLPWHAYSEKKWQVIEKTPSFICSDTCKILDIVLNGEGIALLPEWTYLNSLNKGLVEKINIGWDASFINDHNHKLYLIYDKKTSN